MARTNDLHREALSRLELERGTLYKQGGRTRVALLKPSTYFVSMSSLGLQQVYRVLNQMDDVVCERAFLPDDPAAYERTRTALFTYESRRPVGDHDIVAVSIAYEMEVTGLLRCLELAGLPLYARERGEGWPLVIVGGPLTFSNILPAAPFADVVVMGEAEGLIEQVVRAYQGAESRAAFFDAIENLVGIYLPERHGEQLVPIASANDLELPAYSTILTPYTELSDMHLVESERGCHRRCTFCVMRRSTNGGMRLASVDRILATIPESARRVGLVGAAASDHPRLVDLVRAIVDTGRECSLSSLRADRLSPALLEQLVRGGLRSITVASDGASDRLRKLLEKNIKEKHLRMAAELAREHGLNLKIYMMVGVPGETDEDIDELIAFTREMARIGPRKVSMGIAPFVAKRNTPLDRQPFAGIKLVEQRLERLRKGLRDVCDLRSTSARWAWVEYELAQGGFEMADAAVEVHRASRGGEERFADWKRAITRARASRPHDRVPGLHGLTEPAPLAV